jgi:hypothetical protein
LLPQLLGPDHPVVANRLSNLGSVLAEQGELEEARRILQRAVDARLKVRAPAPHHQQLWHASAMTWYLSYEWPCSGCS